MKLHSPLLICLLCLLATFSMASPGRNSRLRRERLEQRMREQAQAEQDEQAERALRAALLAQGSLTEPTLEQYHVDLTPLRGEADKAQVLGIMARYNWPTNLQEYFILVAEGRDDVTVRISACRIATRAAVSDKYLYSPKFGCREITDMEIDEGLSYYETLLHIADGVFKEGEGSMETDMNRLNINYNLAVRMTRSSFRELSLRFRFARGNRFDNTADPVVTGWDQWVCPHSDEVYEDCLWDHPTTDVAKRMITPYEWHELPR